MIGGLARLPFARNMHVKIKRSEITIEFSMSYLALSVPRTGVEPARLAALAPETSASTIPPPGLFPRVKAPLHYSLYRCR